MRRPRWPRLSVAAAGAAAIGLASVAGVAAGAATAGLSATPSSATGMAAARPTPPPSPRRACPVSAEDRETVTALLSHWAERRRALTDVPGLVLGLACGPEWTWARGFGLADREVGRPATDSTSFRIASITKVFTAMAVLRLRDEGRLALDDPVAEHLPWFAPRGSDTLPPVTLRHLLTHTSGLPTNSAATDFNRMTQPTASEAIAALPSQELVFAPGTAFKYSNLGFAVLGQVVETVSGLPYARYVEREILSPLGLRGTVVHPSPEDAQAAGYHAREPDRPRRRADFLHLAAFTPAGGMATTAGDMTRFLAFLVAPGRIPGVLDDGTLAEMVRVHHWVDTTRGGAGLAWAVERGRGTHVVYHGGGLPTQTSHLRLDLEAGAGVVVLANAEDADPAAYAEEALALLRLAAAPGGGDAVESGEHAAAEDAPGALPDRPRGAGPEAATRDSVALDPSRYAGRYRWGEREAWVVSLGGSLWIIDPAWLPHPLAGRPSGSATRLAPLGGHRFRLEGEWSRGETAEFVVDEPGGKVIRLRMPSLVYRWMGSIAE